MPYSWDLLDEQQAKKNQDPNQPAPQMTGGGTSFSDAAASGTPSKPGQNPSASQGSGFVNLDKYMNANQGGGFGDQFTGKIQGDVDTAKQAQDKGAADFTDASNKGATKWGDVSDAATGLVQNAGDKTTADDAAKIKGWSGATYQGPTGFQDTAAGTQAQGATQKAAQEGQALQKEGGRFALLDQFYGRPQYTQGQKSLDNLLIQNAPGVAAKSNSISNQSQQLQGGLNQKTQDLNNLASANSAATQETAQKTKDLVSGSLKDFSTGLEGRYADYNKANADYNTGLEGDIGSGNITPEELSKLGLNSGDSMYNLNLRDYVNTTPAQANLSQFANDQDYAKYLALNQLAGEDPTELTAANRSQAGTAANLGRDTIDSARLATDRGAVKGQYDSEIAGPQQQLATIKAQIDQYNKAGLPYSHQIDSQLSDAQVAVDAINGKYGINNTIAGRTPGQQGPTAPGRAGVRR